MNYYNEYDPGAAAWLRELINQKQIPEGHVDTRSITEVRPADLAGYVQCHFFAGIGGWAEALRLAGWPDDQPVWTGSCPCQPFSSAGKQKGTADERHLWPEFRRLIAECRPATCFGEQVASRLGREWLSGVRADLEGVGYAVGAADLGAASVGAPHIRQRLYWVGVSEGFGRIETRRHTTGDSAENGHGTRNRACDAGANGRPANPDGGLPGDRGVQPGGEHRQQPQDGGVGGVEHLPGDRREQRGTEPGGRGAASGREPGGVGNPELHGRASDKVRCGVSEGEGESGMLQRPGSSSGFWSSFDLIPCRDGKVRRIERKPVALADGLPDLLDALRHAGASEEQVEAALETFPIARNQPGRVMLLRGYGNSICPQLAAQFILACIECVP